MIILVKVKELNKEAVTSFLDTYLLNPWSRNLLEKLTGFQLVKKFPHILWNPKGSLLHLQVPATCPHPEPVQSST
jgi:hypothetical protein